MPMDALSLALFFHPEYAPEDRLPRAKALVPLFTSNSGVPLSVFETSTDLMSVDRDARFEAGHREITLRDTERSEPISGEVSISHYDDGGWAVISVVFTIYPYDRRETERTWSYATRLAPKVVAAAKPTFAVLTGLSDWPDPSKLKPGQLPPLGPWNWFSLESLPDTRRKQLAALPGAHRFEQIADGFLLQLVPDVYSKPSPDMMAVLAQLGTKYSAPKPPPRE
jgi:hypothetical protein